MDAVGTERAGAGPAADPVRAAPLDEREEFWVVSVARDEGPLRVLTEAERWVAEMAIAGLTNREIAAARGASVHTVANQLQSIYRKLGVCSRSELAALRKA